MSVSSPGRVSIIVPFLDAERFIREAIESVLTQTYGDWDLLLVDDGSSDGSSEIARECAARDPERIRYLTHADGRTHGPAVTRNLGLAHATGEYVAFLDADDVWLPRKLEQQTALAASHAEAGMVYGATEWWFSWTGRDEDRERDFVQPLGVPTGVAAPPSLLGPWFVRQQAAIPNPTNVLVRRSLIERIGGFEESLQAGYEDQAFQAKACVHAEILVADHCWDRYRQHPRSFTALTARSGDETAARRRFLSWLIGYLSAHDVDSGIRGALKRQRIRYAHPWLDRVATRIRSRA